MLDKRIENLNVLSEDSLITPLELKRRYPLNEQSVGTVMAGQNTIKNILERKDKRLFVVLGPCSIHDVTAAREYADRLKQLTYEVSDTLYLVMRVYFEKPRTRTGWQGLINDPAMDGSGNIELGLELARELLLYLANIELAAAGEALDLVSPQYVQDLFAWTAIGARTTESQTHRKMASGFSCAVGFKNATNGNIEVAINAMHAAAKANNFISVDPHGRVAVVRAKGNRYTHIVLRGGTSGANYDAASIADCEVKLSAAGLFENIMVDCSHANSNNDPNQQLQVMQDIIGQIRNGNQSIIGLMLESNLEWGQQSMLSTPQDLQYGVSVTDACIDWQTTEQVIKRLHQELKGHLDRRGEIATR